MTIITSYTSKDTKNTLAGAPLTKYRSMHWLCDILKNFLRDPINIKDERLSKLLVRQDTINTDECYSLFQIGLPYSKDSRKACTTPAIFVSAGTTEYPINTIGRGLDAVTSAINSSPMYKRIVPRKISAKIAILTESFEGTVLLSDTIEDFLVGHSLLFEKEGMVSQFNVLSSSEPEVLDIGSLANAKSLVQIVITVSMWGSIAWTVDTQGPVSRGVTTNTIVQ